MVTRTREKTRVAESGGAIPFGFGFMAQIPVHPEAIYRIKQRIDQPC